MRILEARGRAGGRILTIRHPDIPPVELGAEFAHGDHPDLLHLIKSRGLHAAETCGVSWCFEDGHLHPCEHDATDYLWSRMRRQEHDRPFLDFLKEANLPPQSQAWARAEIEGFNAAYAERIGVHGLVHQDEASENIGGDRSARIVEGYDRIIDTHELDIVYGVTVDEVRWRPGSVALSGHEARRALLTVPLPLLSSLRIHPPPERHIQAAQRLAMGHVYRITCLFQERFWDSSMGFLFSLDDAVPTWWTTAPVASNLLIGWSAAHCADTLRARGIVDGAMATLQRLFGRDVRPLLKNCWWHDWQSDPFSRGAYSYIPAGAMDAPHVLSEPIQDTLYFAGEHTDTEGFTGTVHGAIATGIRAAQQILQGV